MRLRILLYLCVIVISLIPVKRTYAQLDHNYGGTSRYLYTSHYIILTPDGLFPSGVNTHTDRIKLIEQYPISYPNTYHSYEFPATTDMRTRYIYDIFEESNGNSIYTNKDAIFVLSKRYNRIEMALIRKENGISRLKKDILLSEYNCSMLNKPSDMIIIGDKMYWTNTGTNSIGQATIIFNDFTDLYELNNIKYDYIVSCSQPIGISYDEVQGYLYWTNFVGMKSGFGSIARVNLAEYEQKSQATEVVDQEYITNCMGPVDIDYQNWNGKSMLLWTNWLDYRVGGYTSYGEVLNKDRNDKVVFFDFGGSPYKLQLIKSETYIPLLFPSINIAPSMIPSQSSSIEVKKHIAWINMHHGTMGSLEREKLYSILTTEELIDGSDTVKSFYHNNGRIINEKCDYLYCDNSLSNGNKTTYINGMGEALYFDTYPPILDFVAFDNGVNNEFIRRIEWGSRLYGATEPYYAFEYLDLFPGGNRCFIGSLSYLPSNTDINKFHFCSYPDSEIEINLFRKEEFLKCFPFYTSIYGEINCPVSVPSTVTLYAGYDDGNGISIPFPICRSQTISTDQSTGSNVPVVDLSNNNKELELNLNLEAGEKIDLQHLTIESNEKVVQKPMIQDLGDGRVRVFNKSNTSIDEGTSYKAKYIKQNGDTISVSLPIEETNMKKELNNTLFFSLRESYGNSISRFSPNDKVYSKRFFETIKQPQNIETDDIEQRLHWTNGAYSISRMNYSKNNYVEFFLNTKDSIKCFALDLKNEHIYIGHNGYISKWDLDAKSPKDSIIINCGDVRDIEVDTTGDGTIYWINGNTSKICKADLYGNNIHSSLITVTGGAHGIALDAKNNKIYWTRYNNLSVGRANLDGTLVQSSYIAGTTGHSGDIEKSKLDDTFYFKRNEYVASFVPNGSSAPTVNTAFSKVSNAFGLATASDFTTLDKIEVKLYDFQIDNGTYFKKLDTVYFSFKVENNGKGNISSSNVKFSNTDNIIPTYISRVGNGSEDSPYVFKYKIVVTNTFQDKQYDIKLWIEDYYGSRSNTVNPVGAEFMIDSQVPQVIAAEFSDTKIEQFENINLQLIVADGISGYIDRNDITITTIPALNNDFLFVTKSGNSFYYVANTDDTTALNNYDLQVTVKDLSGNQTSYNPTGYEFEVIPNLTADFEYLTLDSVFVRRGTTLQIGFDVLYGGDNMFNENNIQIHTIPPLQNDFNLVDKIGIGTYHDPARYIYEVPISPSETEGNYNIVLSGVDDGGNEAETYSTSKYEFYIDETPPSLSNVSTNKTTYTKGESIILSFDIVDNGSFDISPKNIDIVLNRSFRQNITLTKHTGNHFEYKLPIDALDPKGNLTINIIVTDQSGNQTTSLQLIQVI